MASAAAASSSSAPPTAAVTYFAGTTVPIPVGFKPPTLSSTKSVLRNCVTAVCGCVVYHYGTQDAQTRPCASHVDMIHAYIGVNKYGATNVIRGATHGVFPIPLDPTQFVPPAPTLVGIELNPGPAPRLVGIELNPGPDSVNKNNKNKKQNKNLNKNKNNNKNKNKSNIDMSNTTSLITAPVNVGVIQRGAGKVTMSIPFTSNVLQIQNSSPADSVFIRVGSSGQYTQDQTLACPITSLSMLNFPAEGNPVNWMPVFNNNLLNFAVNFVKYRITKFVVKYLPLQNTLEQGAIAIACVPDSGTAGSFAIPSSLSNVISWSGSMSGPAWAAFEADMTKYVDTNWHDVDVTPQPTIGTTNTALSSEQRWDGFGALAIGSAGIPLSSTNFPLGNIVFTGRVEFLELANANNY